MFVVRSVLSAMDPAADRSSYNPEGVNFFQRGEFADAGLLNSLSGLGVSEGSGPGFYLNPHLAAIQGVPGVPNGGMVHLGGMQSGFPAFPMMASLQGFRGDLTYAPPPLPEARSGDVCQLRAHGVLLRIAWGPEMAPCMPFSGPLGPPLAGCMPVHRACTTPFQACSSRLYRFFCAYNGGAFSAVPYSSVFRTQLPSPLSCFHPCFLAHNRAVVPIPRATSP